jgi:hypothetical protein
MYPSGRWWIGPRAWPLRSLAIPWLAVRAGTNPSRFPHFSIGWSWAQHPRCDLNAGSPKDNLNAGGSDIHGLLGFVSNLVAGASTGSQGPGYEARQAKLLGGCVGGSSRTRCLRAQSLQYNRF